MPSGSNLALKIVPPAPPSATAAFSRLRGRLMSLMGLEEMVRPRLYVVGDDGLTPVAFPKAKKNRTRNLQQLLARVYPGKAKAAKA